MRSVFQGACSLFKASPVTFDDEKSLYENFMLMCDIRWCSFLGTPGVSIKELAEKLQLCGPFHYHIESLKMIKVADLKKDRVQRIQNNLLQDIARLQLAKLALTCWLLENTPERDKTQWNLVNHYKNQIENRQVSFHQIYNNVYQYQWRPYDSADVRTLSHLWLTEEGIATLRNSLEGEVQIVLFDELSKRLYSFSNDNENCKGTM